MPKIEWCKNIAIIGLAFWMGGYQNAGRAEQLPSTVSNFPAEANHEPLAQYGDSVNTMHAEIISVDLKDQKVKVKDRATANRLEVKVSDPSTLPSFVPGDRVRVAFPSSDRATATSVVAEERIKTSSPDQGSKGAKATGESLSQFKKDTANIIHAEIISMNLNNREVGIKDLATGSELKINVADPGSWASFHSGDRVRVIFPSTDKAAAAGVAPEENTP